MFQLSEMQIYKRDSIMSSDNQKNLLAHILDPVKLLIM